MSKVQWLGAVEWLGDIPSCLTGCENTYGLSSGKNWNLEALNKCVAACYQAAAPQEILQVPQAGPVVDCNVFCQGKTGAAKALCLIKCEWQAGAAPSPAGGTPGSEAAPLPAGGTPGSEAAPPPAGGTPGNEAAPPPAQTCPTGQTWDGTKCVVTAVTKPAEPAAEKKTPWGLIIGGVVLVGAAAWALGAFGGGFVGVAANPRGGARKFWKGQPVTLLPGQKEYGHVAGYDPDGSVMVRWSGTTVVTGVQPQNLKAVPPGYAGRASNPSDPKVYLSMSEGRFRVISQGIPIAADLPTAAQALAAADRWKLKVADRMWNGDTGEWETLRRANPQGRSPHRYQVRFLPYIGSPYEEGQTGRVEKELPTLEQAQAFMRKLKEPSSLVEDAELLEYRTSERGGWGSRAIDRWEDKS